MDLELSMLWLYQTCVGLILPTTATQGKSECVLFLGGYAVHWRTSGEATSPGLVISAHIIWVGDQP